MADQAMWQTVGDPKVCPSCSHRGGTTYTREELNTIGWPGSAALLCYTSCRCITIPVRFLRNAAGVGAGVSASRAAEMLGLDTTISVLPFDIQDMLIGLGYESMLNMSYAGVKMEFATIVDFDITGMSLRQILNKYGG